MKTPKLLAALALLLFGIQAGGTTYYVATTGSDSNNGTAVGTPFLTVTKAYNTAANGDTILIRGGTYTDKLSITKSSLVISNYNGETPVLAPSGGGNGFYIGGGGIQVKQNLVTGLTFDGTSMSGGTSLVKISEQSYGNSLSNCIVQYSNGQGILISESGADQPAFNTVINCTIATNAWVNFTGGNSPHAIYLSGVVRSNIIDGNTIHEFSASMANGTVWPDNSLTPHGIHMFSGAGTLLGNVIRNNRIYCDSTNRISNSNFNRGIGVYNDGSYVYNNIITNCHFGLLVQFGASSNLFANNTIAYCGGTDGGSTTINAGTGAVGIASPGTTANQWVNNLVVSNYAQGMSIQSGISAANFLSNNIISRNGTIAGANFTEGTVFTKSGNLIDPTAYNPAFTSATDLHITSSSSARNNGTSGGSIPATDKDGVAIQEGTKDVGAFEYNSGGTTPSVSIVQNGPAFEQGPTASTFTVTRTGSTAGTLTVNYTVTGTATDTTDYSHLSGSVVIGIGNSSATITITPVDDTLVEGNETVILTLAAGSYTIGSPSTDTMTLVDNDFTRTAQGRRF